MSHTMIALERMKDGMQAVSRAARRMLLIGGGAFAFLIKKASDFQETASMFEAVFKEQTKAAEEWAGSTAKALNRSKIAIQGWMASLQDTFVPLGFARDEALELSKQLTQLGIDLASFKNVAEPETLDLLTSAIVGNHEAVRRFGIILTEATVKQEMANMGYKKGGEMSEALGKVMARVNIIMASSADAQGDAARTAGSFANQLRGTLAAANDLIIALGTAFLPVMTDVVAKLTKAILPMTDWVAQNQTAVVAITKHIGKIVLVTAVIIPLITTVAKLAFVLKMAAAAAWTLNTAGAILAFNPISVAAAAAVITIGALIVTYQQLQKEMKELSELEAEGDRWEKLANSALEYALARKKLREEKEKDAQVEEEEAVRTEKRQKQIDKLIQKLTEQGDTFSMSRREIELYRLGITDLTDEELNLIMGLQDEIRLKETAKEKTKALNEELKKITDSQAAYRTSLLALSSDLAVAEGRTTSHEVAVSRLAEQYKVTTEEAERYVTMQERIAESVSQTSFSKAVVALTRNLGVAEGWLSKHEVAVSRIAEQYGVTLDQAEKHVEMQEDLADAVKRERKEREQIMGIQNSVMAVWTRIQNAALGVRQSTVAGSAGAPSRTTPSVTPANDPVRIANDTKSVLERIHEFLETLRTDLEIAGVLR